MATPNDAGWNEDCSADLYKLRLSVDQLLGQYQRSVLGAQAEQYCNGILGLDLVMLG